MEIVYSNTPLNLHFYYIFCYTITAWYI